MDKEQKNEMSNMFIKQNQILNNIYSKLECYSCEGEEEIKIVEKKKIELKKIKKQLVKKYSNIISEF
jgi:hypothetical protein